MSWLLKRLFTSSQQELDGGNVSDRKAIMDYLIKNSSNGKLFGLLSKKSPALMHVCVERINLTDDDKSPRITFSWFEPTGDFLSYVTVSLDDIVAICPFEDKNWGIPGMIDHYFTAMLLPKIPSFS